MKHVVCSLLLLSLTAAQACSDGDDPSVVDGDDDDAALSDGDGGGGDDDDGSPVEGGSARTDGAVGDAARGDSAAPSDASRRDGGALRDAQAARDAETPPARDGAMASGPSSGCGKAVTDPAGKFTAHSIRVGNGDRTYQLFVPEGYQATRRYPVVFRFHGSTGNGLSGGLDIQYTAPKDLIIVAPDGLNTTWTTGSADVALFDALVKAVGEQYCVDLGRLFAFGFSAGAGFSEMLACIRGNTLRGIGAIAGYDWGRGKTCEGQVAAWLVHDSSDTAAPIAGGRAARDRLLQQNGCTMESEPAGSSCVRYRGCADGHPVVWCETQGMGHNIRGDYAPGEVWKFFTALP